MLQILGEIVLDTKIGGVAEYAQGKEGYLFLAMRNWGIRGGIVRSFLACPFFTPLAFFEPLLTQKSRQTGWRAPRFGLVASRTSSHRVVAADRSV